MAVPAGTLEYMAPEIVRLRKRRPAAEVEALRRRGVPLYCAKAREQTPSTPLGKFGVSKTPLTLSVASLAICRWTSGRWRA